MTTFGREECPINVDVNESQIETFWERRHYGINKPIQDQVYEGQLFQNAIHGQGMYKWNERGIYDGTFYSNSKNGYGFVSYPDNSFFEGLFVKNRPFGPGIRTHANGRQDVGFWVDRKLVRLSRSIDFIVPRLAPTAAGKVKLLQFRSLISLTENAFDSIEEILSDLNGPFEHFCQLHAGLIHDPRSVFFDKASFDKAYFDIPTHKTGKLNSIPKESFIKIWRIREPCSTISEDDCDSWEVPKENKKGFLAQMTELQQHSEQFLNKNDYLDSESIFSDDVSENFRQSPEGEKLFPPKLISWNRSDLCRDMLKEIFRYQAFEENVNFTVGKLMLGDRTAFRKTGKTEKQCLEFLKLCSSGPVRAVKELLCDGDISNSLMDGRGNTSLMFATATDQRDVMDVLLDYGVDVNTFNDENLTPLNMCLLRRLSEMHQVSDWETAFLPPESSVTTDQTALEWRAKESIQSLDRIFGDGTSIADEDIVTIDRVSTKNEASASKVSSAKESMQFKIASQMAMLHFKKGLKTDGKASSSSVDAVSSPFASNSSGAMLKAQTKVSNNLTGTRYLFQLSPMNQSIAAFSSPSIDVSIPNENMEGESDSKLTKKVQEIDKTIHMLLHRGADPNVSEVSKPSIHLALFTKDLNLVKILLLHGASPDRQLRYCEGLLTPLHVIALLPPAPENLGICQLLLDFGANPEEETSPEYLIFENEDNILLNPFQGRTPLQLLCMRPDLKYIDSNEFLMDTAIALARVSNKRHFYNGHSYLTLAMLCGNLSLLRNFLQSKLFDPNQILGENLGSALHFLVSTTLQLKTLYDTSIKMCDMLLAAGADPSKKLKFPGNFVGNCIMYGYAEIEKEKERRKLAEASKKETRSSKPDQSQVRDHLKDHIKVVEYLKNASEVTNETHLFSSQPKTAKKFMKENIKTTSEIQNERSEASEMTTKKAIPKKSDHLNLKNSGQLRALQQTDFFDTKQSNPKKITYKQTFEIRNERSESSEMTTKKAIPKSSDHLNLKNSGQLRALQQTDSFETKRSNSKKITNKQTSEIQNERLEASEMTTKKAIPKSSDHLNLKNSGQLRALQQTDSFEMKRSNSKKITNKQTSEIQNERLEASEMTTKKAIPKKSDHLNLKNSGQLRALQQTDSFEMKRSNSKKITSKQTSEFKKHDSRQELKSKVAEKRSEVSKATQDSKKKKLVETEAKGNQKNKQTGKFGFDLVHPKKKEKSELPKRKRKSKTDRLRREKKRRLKRQPVNELPSRRHLPSSYSAAFSENLRRSLLHMFGNCVRVKANEFLLPYVVFRNGDLYYRFQGEATDRKEQYSLI